MDPSLASPPGSSPILAAVLWVQGVLLGTVATVIATIAIAALGFMMLSGRLPVRRGMVAILGCFILFGASSLANSIRSGLADMGGAAEPVPISYAPPAPAPPRPAPPPAPQPRAPQPPAADPFAGAAVPAR
jgi:type IV secretory pathway VirB2 component (pilin)